MGSTPAGGSKEIARNRSPPRFARRLIYIEFSRQKRIGDFEKRKENFLTPMKTEIRIAISGSFRKHLQEIGIALTKFKKSNVKVLAPLTQEAISVNDGFVFLATDNPEKSADILEKEFMANIKKADFLYLVNMGGHVGQSAATEMGVALMNDIPIVTNEDIADFSDEIPKTVQELLKKSVFQRLPIGKIDSDKVVALDLPSFMPYSFSAEEKTLLQSLVEKLLESLKSVKINS